MPELYFTPGPTALYYTVEEHFKNALKTGVTSTSHRGQGFKDIYKACTDNLKALMDIPDDFHVLITSSANEAWERIILNCVEKSSYHICNGAFSGRFAKIAEDLGRNATRLTIADGQVPTFEEIMPSEDDELISICLNESATGAAAPFELIEKIRVKYPNKIIAVDAVSAVPVYPVDFSKIDTLYFSVQKAFGLPAGLGIWIVNDRCVNKAQSLAKKGQIIGSYHQLPEMVEKAAEYQTTETPNILGIYTLGKVAEDMLTKGITAIRREIDYKSTILNMAIDDHSMLNHFVENEKYRSKTVKVAKTAFDSKLLIDYLAKKHIKIGIGYGAYKSEQIRIANFPTHSKEQVEMLVDILADYK